MKTTIDLPKIRQSPSITQLQVTYGHINELIDSLDDAALQELLGGNEDDLDSLLDDIVKETYRVLNVDTDKFNTATLRELNSLAGNIEETLRLNSLTYFIQSVLPDFIFNWHHLEWGNLTQLYQYLCVVASRDSGKSYFFSKAYPIWKMYRYKKSSPLTQVPKEYTLSHLGVLYSAGSDLGITLLDMIKEEIEDNAMLRDRLYPGREGWGKEKIRCKNGAKMIIKSYGGRGRGFHPGWIIVDDFLTDAVIYSEAQRKKTIDYFHSVIMNMIVPGGQVGVVGTPFSAGDLYGDLKKKSGWHVFEYPAIFPDGQLLWQGRHSLEGLLRKKQTQGSLVFTREVLVKPVSSDSTIFPYELIARSFRGMDDFSLINHISNAPVEIVRTVIGCDFAISAAVGADYSVFITLGIDKYDNYYVLNVWRKKGATYKEQITVLKHLNANFRPDIIYMEDNQMQQLFVQGAEELGMPVEGHTTGKGKYDLLAGLPGLVILFENNKIKMPRGNEKSVDVTDTIAMELSSISWTDKGKLEGVGEHDDIPMALWKACLAAKHGTGSFNFSFA